MVAGSGVVAQPFRMLTQSRHASMTEFNIYIIFFFIDEYFISKPSEYGSTWKTLLITIMVVIIIVRIKMGMRIRMRKTACAE